MSATTQVGSGSFTVFPTRQVSSQAIRNQIHQFAGKAEGLANQILGENSTQSYQGPVIIRNHYHYSPFYSSWFYPQPSVIIVDGGRGRRQNNDNTASLILGIVATLGTLIASYAVGSAIARHNDASLELQDASESLHNFYQYAGYATHNDQEVIQEAIHASSLKQRICARIKNSAVGDLALRITLAVGLGTVAAGAFAASPSLLAVGAVLGVISAAAMLIKWGYESSDKSNIRDAQNLQASLIHLKQL